MTSFDKMANKLGILPQEYESSTLLEQWARENMDEKYVPLYLLKAWRLVDADDAIEEHTGEEENDLQSIV